MDPNNPSVPNMNTPVNLNTPPVFPPPQPIVPVQPVQPIQTVVETNTPPQQPPPDSGKLKPWLIPAIVGVGILVLLIIGIFVAKKFLPSGSLGTNILSGIQSEESKLKAQIQIDTDGDKIPDFVEIGAGLNPNSSDFARCQSNKCGNSGKSLASTTNTLIILDSSGSMASNTSGGVSKMDAAKASIRQYLTTISTNENVGLMVYGNKGSNSQSSKNLSCGSAEVLSPIGSLNTSSVDTYLAQISPTGWTPIGLAIEKGITAFAGKEDQKNQIIIVSDGTETCNTDPAGKAAQALASSYKIQVNVIGFAVSIGDESSLSDISNSGGGTFVTANSSSELDAIFEANHQNLNKYVADATCIFDASKEETTCLQDVADKVSEYLGPFRDKNVSNGGLYNIYYDLYSSTYGAYTDKITEVQNAASQQGDAQRKTLIDQ